ncbi:MAG: hypothetical protein GX228_03100 [Firmicutes bacterium]|nr:hypothetical protein [Bacillota bacterium]NLL87907.1 hypothetical protein [Bacillota bacterium]HKM16719.1 hypothetical protein [Limnochordia bacterium]
MRKLLVVGIVVSLLAFGSTALAFDLTDFGLQPAENYDFGGETVTIISWTSDRIPGYFETDLAVMGRVEEAEELFNCKIDWLYTREIPEQNFSRLLAGDSYNDLWHAQNKIGYWELVANDAAYPVYKILPEGYYDAFPPGILAVEEALKYKGQYWGIGPMEWRPIFGYQNDLIFVAYNKTLIDREGLEDPYELYLAGEWDWDAATRIAVAATADLDGDGETDQWGIVDARPWDLAVSNGASLTRVDENGKVIFTGDEPAYLEALEQYRMWWTELKVQMPTNASGDLRNAFVNGRAAMWFYAGAWQLPDYLMPMADEWVLVPYPKGPSVDDYQWTVQAISTTLLPSNAKDPEALVALKTFLWREEDAPQSDVLARHVRNQESAMVFLEGNLEWKGQISRLFENFLATYQDDVRQVGQGNLSPAAAMAALKPIIQANLDDLLGQN